MYRGLWSGFAELYESYVGGSGFSEMWHMGSGVTLKAGSTMQSLLLRLRFGIKIVCRRTALGSSRASSQSWAVSQRRLCGAQNP